MQKSEIKKLEFTADDKHLYLNGEAIFDISPKIEEKVKEDEAKAEDKKED